MGARKQRPGTVCTAGAILLLIANFWRINLAIHDEIGANWLSASTQTDLPQKRSVPRVHVWESVGILPLRCISTLV